MIPSYSLENVLNQYHSLAVDSQTKKKSERPILMTETVQGERRVRLIEKRSELSLLTLILAYFGFGAASLGNVAEVLRKKKWTVQTSELISSLAYLNSKIAAVNKASLIHQVELLPLPPLSLTTLGSLEYAVHTTYQPMGFEKEASEGILDFTHVFRELGAGYVADGTGHGNISRRKRLKEYLWDKVNENFVSEYKQAKVTNLTELKAFLKSYLRKLSGFAENAGTCSTFSFAMIVNFEGEKQVVFAHVGDSALFHIKQDGTVNRLTPADPKHPACQLELGGLYSDEVPILIDSIPVQMGDRICGLTDGVVDFLPQEILYDILGNHKIGTQPLLPLINKLKTAIETTDNPNGLKFDSKDVKGSDDIAAFIFEVSD